MCNAISRNNAQLPQCMFTAYFYGARNKMEAISNEKWIGDTWMEKGEKLHTLL